MGTALVATAIAAAIVYRCATILVRPFIERRARHARPTLPTIVFAAIIAAVTLAGYRQFGILNDPNTLSRITSLLCGLVVTAALIVGSLPAPRRR